MPRWRPEIGGRVCAIFVLTLMFASCGSKVSNVESKVFVRTMIPHHEQGIELIEIGQIRSDDVRLRKLIFEMGSYHHADLGVLVGMTNENEERVVDFPGDVGREVLGQLSRLEGGDFDKAWLAAMIHHHEGALLIADRLFHARNADPELLEFARSVVVTQTAEIAAMKELLLELEEP